MLNTHLHCLFVGNLSCRLLVLSEFVLASYQFVFTICTSIKLGKVIIFEQPKYPMLILIRKRIIRKIPTYLETAIFPNLIIFL